MDEEYDDFLGIEVEFDDEEDIKKKKKKKDDFIEIDAIERTIEFIEQEKEVEAQTRRRRSTTGRGLTLINNTVDPSKLSNLALWLKADAGIQKFSYAYVSEIIIAGTSTPDFNGTYTANGVPLWDSGENRPQNYSFSGPTGKTISWDINTALFTVTSQGSMASFSSSDGESWSPNTIISEFVITGFTGIYSGANGRYVYAEEGYYDKDGGGYYVQGSELRDANSDITIATNNNNYQGAWTPTQYFSTITFSNAGETSIDMNGVYTRTDSSIDMFGIGFFASGGRFIQWDDEGGWWFTNGDFYRNYSSSFDDDWQPENGDEPVPTAVYSNSARNVGSPTSTTTITPTGSISGSVTNTIENTELVTFWGDQSGNDNYAAISPYQSPTLVLNSLNSKPSLAFYGYGEQMILANPVGGSTATYFIVCKNLNSVRGSMFLCSSNVYVQYIGVVMDEAYNPDGRDRFTLSQNDAGAGNEGELAFSGPTAGSNYFIGSAIQDGSSGTAFLNGVSGVNVGTIDQSFTFDSIGGYPDPAYNINGNIAEIIVYNRALTTQERQQVENYLNQKYQIY